MAQGDCFIKAMEVFNSLLGQGVDAQLVHGYPRYYGPGDGDVAGGRFHHAWVEANIGDGHTLVYDFSNDREVTLPQAVYYDAGGIVDGEHTLKYGMGAAVTQMVEYGHYGPWDGSAPPVADTEGAA